MKIAVTAHVCVSGRPAPRRCRRALTLVFTATLSVLSASVARSGELPESPLEWSGFGTLGATYHNSPGLEYRRDETQPRGTAPGSVDLETDSVFGLQAQAHFGPHVLALVQGLTRLGPDGSWRPRVERALLAFTPDEAINVRVGRIGFDAYPLAESPEVGFTYLPIRPAPEFFGLFTSECLDGGDVSFKWSLAEGVASLRLLGGHTDGRQVPERGVVVSDASVYTGGQLGFMRGPLLLRISYLHVRNDEIPNLSDLVVALNATAVPQATLLAGRLSGTSHDTDGVQFGVAYDGRPFQAQLLLTHINSSVAAGTKLNIGVLTAGYRVGSLTPYVAYAAAAPFDTILPTGLPQTPPFAELNAAGRSAQIDWRLSQRTLSAGTRYDISSHLDLKAQLDWVRADASNLIYDTAPGSRAAHLVLFGAALDFVF